MKQRLFNSLNRNTFLFTGGLAGVAHETLLQHAERPTLLILFAAMMGLPAFLPQSTPTNTEEKAREIEVVKKMEEEHKEAGAREKSPADTNESKTK